jgi:hypothetical protein
VIPAIGSHRYAETGFEKGLQVGLGVVAAPFADLSNGQVGFAQ